MSTPSWTTISTVVNFDISAEARHLTSPWTTWPSSRTCLSMPLRRRSYVGSRSMAAHRSSSSSSRSRWRLLRLNTSVGSCQASRKLAEAPWLRRLLEAQLRWLLVDLARSSPASADAILGFQLPASRLTDLLRPTCQDKKEKRWKQHLMNWLHSPESNVRTLNSTTSYRTAARSISPTNTGSRSIQNNKTMSNERTVPTEGGPTCWKPEPDHERREGDRTAKSSRGRRTDPSPPWHNVAKWRAISVSQSGPGDGVSLFRFPSSGDAKI